MDEPFSIFLLTVVLPLAWLAPRLGLYSTPALRWTTRIFLVALVVLRFPRHGVDATLLRRIDLVLLGTAVGLLLLRRVAPEFLRNRGFRKGLFAIASAAVVAYTNFFAFHGGSWIQYHDVAHYYLGSKYFHELGYQRLYVALLRAEEEEYGGLLSQTARQIPGNYLVPSEQLLARSDAVKARFTPRRWRQFRDDTRMFRDAMGPSWAEVVKDHGFNPTPIWALIGGALANRVPAGSKRGLFLLTLLDPVLLASSLAAVAWVFGVETALLALTYFCLCFGAGFGWTGGAFLRQLWFSALVLSAALAGCSRSTAGGALLGVSASVRVFPALLVAGPAFRIVAAWTRGESPPVRCARFLVGFSITIALLFGLTLLQATGLGHWLEFARNITAHGESASANVIGVTKWLLYAASCNWADGACVQNVYTAQLGILFLGSLLWVSLRSSREDDPVALLALGTLLVFCGLNLSGYYYTFLVLLVLARRPSDGALAYVFGVELLVYVVALFERHETMLYLYKSLLLGWLFVALHVDGMRTEIARRLGYDAADGIDSPPPGDPSGARHARAAEVPPDLTRSSALR